MKIIDDTWWEGQESFRLILVNPGSSMAGGATLGGQTTTKIILDDPEDRKFEQICFHLELGTIIMT